MVSAGKRALRGGTPLADERGFTLVELMVGSLVALMVMGAAVMVTSQVQRGYARQLEAAGTAEEARYAVDWIARELKLAGSNPYDITVSDCPRAGTNFLPIQLDPNGNGINDDLRIHMDVGMPNGLLGGSAGACGEPNEDITIAYDPATQTITRLSASEREHGGRRHRARRDWSNGIPPRIELAVERVVQIHAARIEE